MLSSSTLAQPVCPSSKFVAHFECFDMTLQTRCLWSQFFIIERIEAKALHLHFPLTHLHLLARFAEEVAFWQIVDACSRDELTAL